MIKKSVGEITGKRIVTIDTQKFTPGDTRLVFSDYVFQVFREIKFKFKMAYIPNRELGGLTIEF